MSSGEKLLRADYREAAKAHAPDTHCATIKGILLLHGKLHSTLVVSVKINHEQKIMAQMIIKETNICLAISLLCSFINV